MVDAIGFSDKLIKFVTNLSVPQSLKLDAFSGTNPDNIAYLSTTNDCYEETKTAVSTLSENDDLSPNSITLAGIGECSGKPICQESLLTATINRCVCLLILLSLV